MTGIDRERWRALDPLLDEALELPASERAAWLAALGARSPTLAAELRTLLNAEEAADARGFLAAPLVTPTGAASVSPHLTPPAVPRPGLEIGDYTLERAVGRGGMGSVWLARRADGRFEGRVAIKFLHHTLLDERGPERFRREGSMLARLAHPGIARLHDAGVAPSGQPYLVLEYVEGETIDAFCDARRLPVEARVRLVLQVLSAVGHAHERLIIHRDLKPSNILVTAGDAGAQTKLLDFGIAKLIDTDDPRAAITIDGGRALTPEFAAPEQLLGDQITTASDVYAVGVLLYVLLTGRRPHELAGRPLTEFAYAVVGNDPARPSTRFSDGPPDADVDARAEARGATADALRRQLAGDLDAIAMKALHRDPTRRYPTAAALADDLQRWLDGRTVRARPDSAGYRMRKFVGRHRGAVAIAIAAVALVIGAAVRERSLRGRAEAEARKAHAVEDYLVSVFQVADPDVSGATKGADITARALLDRGAARVDSALGDQPDVQAELRGVLGRVYGSLGLYADAEPLLRRSLEQRRGVYGARHPLVAEAMDRLGDVLVQQNRFDEAEPLLKEALVQRRALVGASTAETAVSVDHLATLYQERGQLDAAEPLFREAVDVRRAINGPNSPELGSALNNLGLLLNLRGRYDDAVPLYRQALAVELRALGENHPATAQVLHNLAQAQHNRGQFAEADTLYRRALAVKRRLLGDAHPSVTVNLNNLGVMLAQELGRVDEGEALIREALALDRKMFGEPHSYVSESLRNLATVVRLKGDFDEAERMFRQTLAMNRALYGAEHPRVAVSLMHIGTTRYLKGDLATAIPLFRQAHAMLVRTVGEKHRNALSSAVQLARAVRESGDPSEAERLLRRVESQIDTASRAQRPYLVGALVTLADALADEGLAAEGASVAERGLALSRGRFGEDDWRTGEAKVVLARCLAASGAGRSPRVEALAREGVAAIEANRRGQPRLAARARDVVAGLGRAR